MTTSTSSNSSVTAVSPTLLPTNSWTEMFLGGLKVSTIAKTAGALASFFVLKRVLFPFTPPVATTSNDPTTVGTAASSATATSQKVFDGRFPLKHMNNNHPCYVDLIEVYSRLYPSNQEHMSCFKMTLEAVEAIETALHSLPQTSCEDGPLLVSQAAERRKDARLVLTGLANDEKDEAFSETRKKCLLDLQKSIDVALGARVDLLQHLVSEKYWASMGV